MSIKEHNPMFNVNYLGRSPESWLLMQDQYNLWAVRQEVNLDNFQAIQFA